MTKLQFNRRGRRVRVGTLALPVLLALGGILAACSHHDEERPTPPVASNPDPAPPVATDSFVTYVTQLVASLSETDEPQSTDGVSVTTPETSEPVPLPGA